MSEKEQAPLTTTEDIIDTNIQIVTSNLNTIRLQINKFSKDEVKDNIKMAIKVLQTLVNDLERK